MFVQVMQGTTSRGAEVREAMDRWLRDLSGGADGWLGSTGGVTADGTFVGLVRFASEEQARRNSDRPEQGQWWAETSRLFDGDVTFHEGTRVWADTPGDPGSAGFVQVIHGRSSDPDRTWELQESVTDWTGGRSDLLGGLVVEHDDGYTGAFYFTSEADAREGERREPPEADRAAMEEMEALEGPREFLDLADPWLAGP
jgi:hypothetical protein